jgi:hypothetical protein
MNDSNEVEDAVAHWPQNSIKPIKVEFEIRDLIMVPITF